MWARIEGRQFLIEAVPYAGAERFLDGLEMVSSRSRPTKDPAFMKAYGFASL
jgi:hypothetical protein